MIPYFFMKGETDEKIEEVVETFRQWNMMNRRHKATEKLKKWCEKYLPLKDGKPRTYDNVVTAKPDELKELKEYIDEHRTDFIQYNKELHIDANTGANNQLKKHYVIGRLYENMTDYAKNHLIKKLGNRVCPYCNRNYNFSSGGVNTCQLDHFYSKSRYPILAASFYNLIPVCATCNLLKSANDFSYYPHINDDELLRFSFTINRADFYKSKDCIDIVVQLSDEAYRPQVNTLKLEEIYQGHRDVVLDIVNKHRIFSEKYLQTLCQEFDFLDSVQELRELIYNVPLDKDRRNDRPLSKLTQDILEEIENL